MQEYIYVLTDPRNEQERYVGKTADPQRRLYEHIQAGTVSEYRRWIIDLVSSGNVPEMKIVKVVDADIAEAEEIKTIGEKLLEGHPLTNTRNGNAPSVSGKLAEISEAYRSTKMKSRFLEVLSTMHRFTRNGDMGFSSDYDAQLGVQQIGWIDRNAGAYIPSEKINYIFDVCDAALTKNYFYKAAFLAEMLETTGNKRMTIPKRFCGKVFRVLHVNDKFLQAIGAK